MGNSFGKFVLVLALLTALSGKAQAKDLDDLSYFARCYAHLTGRPLPLDHASRAKIANHQTTGLQACFDLLDKAQMTSNNRIVSDPEAKLVLNQFYEFHRSWFPVASFEQMQAYVLNYGSFSAIDSTEPALMLTYNLFGYGSPKYSQVLTDAKGVVAFRELDADLNTRLYNGKTNSVLPLRRISNKRAPEYENAEIGFRTSVDFGPDYSTSEIIRFNPIQIGELVGIKPQDQNVTVSNYWPGITRLTGKPSKAENIATSGAAAGFNFYSSQGGGVLGLQSQMLLNWGHEIGQAANGSLKLPRRWISNSLGSLLCKELPALRESDVPSFLETSTSADVAPFRQGTSCLQCHATMDQMASTGRNFLVSQTDYTGRGTINPATSTVGLASYMLGRYPSSIARTYSWSSTPVTDFHKTTPLGRVYMRTFNGSLVNTPVQNIAEAGAVLATTDDLYQCAAKRYFEYFTGIKVPLYDRGDPRFVSQTAALSAAAIRNRQFVEKLARDLKDDNQQSVRKMIRSILASSYYKDSIYLSGEDAP